MGSEDDFKFEEISPKIPRMQILRKLSPLLPPVYLPLWPPWLSKNVLGGFWHLSPLKFEEISPKIPRMQILRKLSPLLPPVYSPPWPPWVSKIFLGGFLHLSQLKFEEITCKGHDAVVSLSAGDDTRPVEA